MNSLKRRGCKIEQLQKRKYEIAITGYENYKVAQKVVGYLIKEYGLKVISTGTNICFGPPLMYLLESEERQMIVRAK